VIPPLLRGPAIALDPMAVVITSYQDVWLYGQLPNFAYLGLALVVSLVLLSIATQIFESRRDEFAEVI
jgi:lipopolysaccharide transport system permease protein